MGLEKYRHYRELGKDKGVKAENELPFLRPRIFVYLIAIISFTVRLELFIATLRTPSLPRISDTGSFVY